MKTTGLTIIEAIQSGLPFKRESWGKLIIVKNSKFYWLHDGVEVSLASFDILANDYMLKLPEVTITREKLAEAWGRQVAIVQRTDIRNEIKRAKGEV